MRALRILIVLMILFAAVPGRAGVSDPAEIVENAQVESAPTVRATEAETAATESSEAPSVAEKVSTTVGNSVNTVKGWLSKGLQTLTGKPNSDVATKPESGSKASSPQAPLSAPLPESMPQPLAQDPNAPEASQAEAAAQAAQAEQQKQNQVKALTETFATPDFKREVRAEDLQEARRRLKTEGATVAAKPGRKPQKGLNLSKSGVPLFPMEVKQTIKLPGGKTKVVLNPLKNIPRIDIGEEPTLSKADYLGRSFAPSLVQAQDFKSLPSPELISEAAVRAVTAKPVAMVVPATDLDKGRFGIDKIVTKETIAKSLPKIGKLATVTEKPVKELSVAQMRMLAALIIYGKGDRCNVLIGLFDELSKVQNLTNEANFHLGQCAYRMKMTSLGFERLSTLVTSEDRDFGTDAIRTLAVDLPMEYEVIFAKIIRNLKNTKLIPKENRDEVNYLTAKGSFKEGDYQSARDYAERLPETSARYGNAQYLIGVSWFALGNSVKGSGKLETLRHWLADKKINDKNLNSLTAVNLARIKFTQGRYKEALPLYMSIDKDHPLWVQGLIEQGWTQLAMDDFSGAIGNMYSLHSPYFRAVYKPESFVVRTIGYLNICQYGDAYRTLSWLEREYRPWIESVAKFSQEKKLASDYYDTAIRYLKGKSSDDVDGLPYQVIREMARQKEFLNAQTSLNAKAEETLRYEGLDQVIQKEKLALKERERKGTNRFRDLKAKIAKGEKERMAAPQLEEMRRQMRQERDLVLGLRFQQQTLEASRLSYLKLQPVIMAKIGRESYQLREIAGRDLVETLTRVRGEMNTVLENNEFLRYEVFSGSGENIRYQVAGGKIAESNRLPASVKPEKMQNWSFDGEYWEDEIGSYRSSLKNNCPQIGKMSEFFKEQREKDAGAKGQAAVEKGGN